MFVRTPLGQKVFLYVDFEMTNQTDVNVKFVLKSKSRRTTCKLLAAVCLA